MYTHDLSVKEELDDAPENEAKLEEEPLASSPQYASNSRPESVHSKARLSVDLSEKDDEPEEEVVNVKVRSKARRINSDDEDEV
ncbi:hypothetical protein CB1_002048005 [Camelus ferus]|nr:hypothetical protein CB1_002048005 [Camelus ferus]